MSSYAEVAASQEREEKLAHATIMLEVGLSPFLIHRLQDMMWYVTRDGLVTPFEHLWSLMDKNFGDLALACSINDQTSLETLAGVMVFVKQNFLIPTPKSFVKAMNFIDELVIHLSRSPRMNLSLFRFLGNLPISSKAASSLNVLHNIHNYETLKSSTTNGMFDDTLSSVPDGARLIIKRVVNGFPAHLLFLDDPLYSFQIQEFFEVEMVNFLHHIGVSEPYIRRVSRALDDDERNPPEKAEHQGGFTYFGLLSINDQVVTGSGPFSGASKFDRQIFADAIDFLRNDEGIMSGIHPVDKIVSFDYRAFRPNFKDAGLSNGGDRAVLVLNAERENICKRTIDEV
jgi:hypothetical protein